MREIDDSVDQVVKKAPDSGFEVSNAHLGGDLAKGSVEESNHQVGVLILDPLGVITSLSSGAVELTGYSPPEIIGKHISVLYEPSDVKSGKPSEELNIAETEGKFTGYCRRRRADGSVFFAKVMTCEIRDEQGGMAGFSVIIEDLGGPDGEGITRERLGEELDAILDEHPKFIALGLDEDSKVVLWNKALEELTGILRVKAKGKHILDLIDTRSDYFDFSRGVKAILKSGQDVPEIKWSFTSQDGSKRSVSARVFPMKIDGGNSVALFLGIDVSDLWDSYEKLEWFDRMYNVMNRVCFLGREKNISRILNEICRVLVKYGGFYMAWIGFLKRENYNIEPVAWAGEEKGFLSSVRFTALDIPEGREPSGSALRTGKSVVCQDISKETHISVWKNEALKRGYKSAVSFPVRVENQVSACLTIYSNKPDFFDEEIVRILEPIVETISFYLEAAEIDRRREKAEEAQKRSEKYYRSLMDNVLDIIAILGVDEKIRYISPSVEKVLGYKRSQLRDREITRIIYPSDAESFSMLLSAALKGPNVSCESRVKFLAENGDLRVLDVKARMFRDPYGWIGVILCARDITDRVRVEEKLKKSEETARAILNSTEDIIILIDRAGTMLAVNRVCAANFGMEIEELIGKNLFNVSSVDPLGQSIRKQKVLSVFEKGKPIRYENTYRARVYDCAAYPVFDEEGNVSRVAIVARDITERQQAEEARRKDRDLVLAVLQAAGTLLLVLDREGRIIIFNKACEKTTGYSYEEVRGKALWSSLLQQEESARFISIFQEIIRGSVHENFEMNLVSKTGEARTIEWSSSSIKGGGGSVEYVVLTGVDITERKKAENALKESERQYRTIFDSTGTAMCSVSNLGVIRFANNEFMRMLGYSQSEITDNMPLFKIVFPDDRAGFEEFFKGVVQGTVFPQDHWECRVVSRSGQLLDTIATASYIPGRGEVVVSLIDITHEKSVEREIEKTAERLKHFLIVASHELRHPVTVLKAYANTLIQLIKTAPLEMVEDILCDIDQATDRLTGYVEELMDVARVEQGGFTLRWEVFGIGEVIDEIRDYVEARGSGNSFETRIEQSVSCLFADKDKIVQVLIILVDNAIKYSPPASPIEIQVEGIENGVRISVLDRGPGIDEEHREKVFERFYQIEDAMHHSKPGLGMGLYIAKEIIGAHGREIWCEGREGGGTAFRFYLPGAGSENQQV